MEYLTSDRHGNEFSAIEFESGYGQFPAGHYFGSKGYTYMIWMKRVNYISFGGIIAFSKRNDRYDGIEMYLYSSTGRLQVSNWNGLSFFEFTTPSSLPIGSWVHLAVASDSKIANVYIDSIYVGSLTGVPSTGEHIFNYLGWFEIEGQKARAAFDEFKIFNRQLTPEEISYEKELTKQIVYQQPLFIPAASEEFTEGLVHYWPMAGSTRDVINGMDMNIIKNGKLCEDRFGNKESGKFRGYIYE